MPDIPVLNVRSLEITNSGWITNYEAFKSQLTNVLSILKKSIPFNRNFALDLEDILFQPFTVISANSIVIVIEDVVRFYFPYAEIVDSTVEMDDTNRTYSISLEIEVEFLGTTVKIKEEYQSYG